MRRLPGLIVLFVLLAATGCGHPDVRAGENALGQGRYREAVEHLSRARAVVSPEEFPVDALAGAHRAYAGRLMAEGRCGAGRDQLLLAEALSRQVIADRKALFDCMQAHGEIDPETQINDLRRLLVLGDTRPEVRSPLMRLLLDAGRDDEAVVHAPALGRDLALTLEDHQRLAWAYARLGRLAEAEPHLLKVLQADPADLMARLKLAEVYEARGANGEARRALQALTVDHPDNPALWLRLAEHLQREGDAAGARAAHAEANRLRGITFEPRDLRPLKKSRH